MKARPPISRAACALACILSAGLPALPQEGGAAIKADAGGLGEGLSRALGAEPALKAELASLEAKRLSLEANYAVEPLPLSFSAGGEGDFLPLATTSRLSFPLSLGASLGLGLPGLGPAKARALGSELGFLEISRAQAVNAAAARILAACLGAAEAFAALEAAREGSDRAELARTRPRGAGEDEARAALLSADLALELEKAGARYASSIEAARLAWGAEPPGLVSLEAFLRAIAVPASTLTLGAARASFESAKSGAALELAKASSLSLSFSFSGELNPANFSGLSLGLSASLAFSPRPREGAAKAASAQASVAAAAGKLSAAEAEAARARGGLELSVASAERQLALAEQALAAAESLARLSKARLDAGAGTGQDYAASLDLVSARRRGRDEARFDLLGLRLELLRLSGAFSGSLPVMKEGGHP